MNPQERQYQEHLRKCEAALKEARDMIDALLPPNDMGLDDFGEILETLKDAVSNARYEHRQMVYFNDPAMYNQVRSK